MAAAINYMWEFQPNVLIMHCNTTKDNDKCKNPQTGVVNNTFIWDLKTETIRESKFVLDPEYQDLQVDIYGTPSFSMFRTFFFDNKGTVESPAYFVSNCKEEIIRKEKWVCSHLQKYRVLENDKDIIVEGVFENKNVKQLALRKIRYCKRKELSTYLMFEMEEAPQEGWDCDLVSDVMKLMEYEEYL